MKTGNINTALRLLLFAVSVLITCIVVKTGLTAAEEAKRISYNAVNQMSELNHDLEDSGIMMFDDNEVYGSEVVNLIKKELGDYTLEETSPISISVRTVVSSNTYTNNSCITHVKDFTDISYIKPTAIFQGDIIKNSNDIIIGINFVQK